MAKNELVAVVSFFDYNFCLAEQMLEIKLAALNTPTCYTERVLLCVAAGYLNNFNLMTQQSQMP